MRLTMRIFIGTALCFAFSYFSAAIGRLGSVEAIASKYVKDSGKTLHVEVERKFPRKEIKEIEIITVDSNVQLNVTDSDELVVNSSGDYPIDSAQNESILESHIDNGKLILKMDHIEGALNFSLSGINLNVNSGGKMSLTIPKGLVQVTVKTVSGDISLNDLAINTLDVNTVSGDVIGEKSNSEKLRIKTTSGDLTWNGEILDLEGKSVSGDIDLELTNNEPKIEAKTVSGDVSVNFDKTPGIEVKFVTTSGDVDIAAEFKKTSSGDEDSTVKIGSGKGLVAVKTISGNLKLIKR